MEGWIDLGKINRFGRVDIDKLEEIYSRMVFCDHVYTEVDVRVVRYNGSLPLALVERRYKCGKCGGETTITTWEEISKV